MNFPANWIRGSITTPFPLLSAQSVHRAPRHHHPLVMLRQLLIMSGLAADSPACVADCSGRGECHNGTCLCEIRFAGEYCNGPNLPYHAGIGGGFLVIAFVCAVQLLVCVLAEYQRLKAPSLMRACRVTTQKYLYFCTFLATVIRGAYFLYPENFQEGWTSSLLSAYYPLLMSSSSLIVCFWAEVFHLQDIRWEKPQFLSKSFLGFVTFNIISYSLLLAEVLTTQFAVPPSHDRTFYTHIFNGCYAVLLFIVVVFFLIYGVEVYFKVRGGFVRKPVHLLAHSNRSGPSSPIKRKVDPNDACAEPLTSAQSEIKAAIVKQNSIQHDESADSEEFRPDINNSQLHQSRIGLLSQALMLILIVGFLCSETLSEFWKTKVPVNSRNWHDIVFRLVEIGVAIWFPAVLWNCMQPAELWILNPRKLLNKLDQKTTEYIPTTEQSLTESDAFIPSTSTTTIHRECWICYDSDKPDPLIEPCECTGDVSAVHHECLRRWLMESSTSSAAEALKCKVCNTQYDVRSTSRLDWEKGFTAHHWGSTVVIVTCLCAAVAVSWIIIQVFEDSYIRMLSASVALLIIYVCIKFLSQNTVSAYQRAKVGAINIESHQVTTISGNVTVDIADNSSSTQVDLQSTEQISTNKINAN